MRGYPWLGLVASICLGCSPNAASSSGPKGSTNSLEPGGDSDDPSGLFGAEECEVGECVDLVGQSALAACGDGLLSDDEACDDANNVDGDGCSSDCLVVDPGFSCNPPGQTCRPIARCGDGNLGRTELCDDGNAEPGDGCSPSCKIELGFKCEGEPSLCSPTTCGDSLSEGAESCDDGNAQPFDGCSASCQKEPNCAAGPCTSECGDGLVIDEDCDDGNRIDGDGCSIDCLIEPGFECSEEADCERIDGECILRVSAIFRDFTSGHSDFAGSCDAQVMGIPAATLGADGKPTLASEVL
jgi:cysteine-rich repeat protein